MTPFNRIFANRVMMCKYNVKNKDCKFQRYIKYALSNIDNWNGKVKKEYKINKNDSQSIKETKIYRYANKYED